MLATRNTMDSVVESERVVWEAEQKMLPRSERDCTTCRGRGWRYVDHGWYQVLVLCSSCFGECTFFSMHEWREQESVRQFNKSLGFATAYGMSVEKLVDYTLQYSKADAELTVKQFKKYMRTIQKDWDKLNGDAKRLGLK